MMALDTLSYFSGTLLTIPVVVVVMTLTLFWPTRTMLGVAVGLGVVGKHLFMGAVAPDAQVTPATVIGATFGCAAWAWAGMALGRRMNLRKDRT